MASSRLTSAEEVANEKNERKDEENVDHHGCDMENDECADPRKEAKKSEAKKYKLHKVSP